MIFISQSKCFFFEAHFFGYWSPDCDSKEVEGIKIYVSLPIFVSIYALYALGFLRRWSRANGEFVGNSSRDWSEVSDLRSN